MLDLPSRVHLVPLAIGQNTHRSTVHLGRLQTGAIGTFPHDGAASLRSAGTMPAVNIGGSAIAGIWSPVLCVASCRVACPIATSEASVPGVDTRVKRTHRREGQNNQKAARFS